MVELNDEPVTRELTRRDAWKLAGAAAGVVAVSRFWPPTVAKAAALAPAPAAPPWNHNPASPIGPNHWGTIGYPDNRPVLPLNGRVVSFQGSGRDRGGNP